MTKAILAAPAFAALLLAGCDSRNDVPAKRTDVPARAAGTDTPAATSPPPPPTISSAPATPSAASLAPTYSPYSLPEAPKTRPGPTERNPIPAVAYWRTALEEHRYGDARSVWGDNGAASGQSAAQFAAAWDKYRIIDITVGKGDQEGAAGSSFYDAPVTVSGLTRAGKPYNLSGTITLRRVNDVDGASPEQLRWHIERSTLRP